MESPVLAADDPAGNRRVWSEWLRRPDWRGVPTHEGDVQEQRDAWDVGYVLAVEHWPLSVITTVAAENDEDIEPTIMTGCYGLAEPGGAFDSSELPERVRNRMLMAAQAARSAPDYESIMSNLDKNSIADLIDADDWSLVIISACLISMWEHDQSPMSGAIMSPADVARLVADILDAAPPSLLADSAR